MIIDKEESLQEFIDNFREELIKKARNNPVAFRAAMGPCFGGLPIREDRRLPADIMLTIPRQPGKTTAMRIIKGREGEQMYHLLEMDFGKLEARMAAALQAHLAEQVDSIFPPLPVSFSEPAKITDYKRAVKRKPNTGPKGRW